MVALEKMAATALALIPPVTASPKAQYQWRVRVGVVLAMLFMGASYLAAGIAGLVPSVVAKASDIAEIDTKLRAVAQQVQALADDGKRMRLSMLGPQIIEMQSRYCETIGNARAGGPRALYRAQLDALLDEYQSLKGQAFRLPSCAEL